MPLVQVDASVTTGEAGQLVAHHRARTHGERILANWVTLSLWTSMPDLASVELTVLVLSRSKVACPRLQTKPLVKAEATVLIRSCTAQAAGSAPAVRFPFASAQPRPASAACLTSSVGLAAPHHVQRRPACPVLHPLPDLFRTGVSNSAADLGRVASNPGRGHGYSSQRLSDNASHYRWTRLTLGGRDGVEAQCGNQDNAKTDYQGTSH